MTTTLAGGRAARRQTMRRIRPRRSPAVPLLLAVWAGAAGVLWLWWRNTPAISDDTGKILGAGRITGLLAGYLMALVVLQRPGFRRWSGASGPTGSPAGTP